MHRYISECILCPYRVHVSCLVLSRLVSCRPNRGGVRVCRCHCAVEPEPESEPGVLVLVVVVVVVVVFVVCCSCVCRVLLAVCLTLLLGFLAFWLLSRRVTSCVVVCCLVLCHVLLLLCGCVLWTACQRIRKDR